MKKKAFIRIDGIKIFDNTTSGCEDSFTTALVYLNVFEWMRIELNDGWINIGAMSFFDMKSLVRIMNSLEKWAKQINYSQIDFCGHLSNRKLRMLRSYGFTLLSSNEASEYYLRLFFND